MDGLDDVGTCPHAVAHIDAAAHARIHRLYKLQHVEWRWKDFVLWPVIVDGDLDVVFLHELFHARQRGGRWIPGNDDLDAGSLAVFELGADIVVIVLLEVDGTYSVQVNAVRLVVRDGLRLCRRIHRQMILRVLGIEAGDLQLLHPCDHLRALKVAEGVARDSQLDR